MAKVCRKSSLFLFLLISIVFSCIICLCSVLYISLELLIISLLPVSIYYLLFPIYCKPVVFLGIAYSLAMIYFHSSSDIFLHSSFIVGIPRITWSSYCSAIVELNYPFGLLRDHPLHSKHWKTCGWVEKLCGTTFNILFFLPLFLLFLLQHLPSFLYLAPFIYFLLVCSTLLFADCNTWYTSNLFLVIVYLFCWFLSIILLFYPFVFQVSPHPKYLIIWCSNVYASILLYPFVKNK